MIKNTFLIPIFFAVSLLILSSCSKKDNETANKDINAQFVAVDDKDIHESEKDLKEVDYKDIYDKLSSKGQWIQVSGKELGLNDKGTSGVEMDFQNTLYSILGINTAYAQDAGLYFVWKPADNLAVTLGTQTSSPPVQPAVYV